MSTLLKNGLQCLLTLLFLFSGLITVAYGDDAPKLDLRGYQLKNGAITIGYHDDFVDPYFAMRALLTAQEEGMDVEQVALPFINWLINKQRADGRFDRYCKKGNQYVSCMIADADDVDMVMWAQLLTLFADSPKMPVGWQKSYTKSLNYLENELYDKKTGIYVIFKEDPVGLFMDNVEIAHAYLQLAKLKKQQGHLTESARLELRGLALIGSIENVFGKGPYHEVSTQPNETKGFYPGAIAQIYPWIFPLPWEQTNHTSFIDWFYDWNIEVELPKSDYAWGLTAIAAKHAGNEDFVKNWLHNASSLRAGAKWNVVEEMVYQALKAHQ